MRLASGIDVPLASRYDGAMKKLRFKLHEGRLLAESWDAVRRFVLERDRHTCQRCLVTARSLWERVGVVSMHIHHLTPRCVGGSDYPTNLMTLCPQCHKAEHSGRNGLAPKDRCGYPDVIARFVEAGVAETAQKIMRCADRVARNHNGTISADKLGKSNDWFRKRPALVDAALDLLAEEGLLLLRTGRRGRNFDVVA